jgi:hypothetical protein
MEIPDFSKGLFLKYPLIKRLTGVLTDTGDV